MEKIIPHQNGLAQKTPNLGTRKGTLSKMLSKFIYEKHIPIAKLAKLIGTKPKTILQILNGHKPEIAIEMAIIKLYCATKWNNKEV